VLVGSAAVLPAFTADRCLDAQTINDLAMDNYVEVDWTTATHSSLARDVFNHYTQCAVPRDVGGSEINYCFSFRLIE